MSQPKPTPEQPDPIDEPVAAESVTAESVTAESVTAESVTAETVTAEPEVPLNRAERRAKAKSNEPSHVGPRAGRTAQGGSARSHTKRQLS